MSNKEKQSKRATFLDVASSQDQLRSLIDKLIAENRPLHDTKERNKYIRLFRESTFGIGTKKPFLIKGQNKTYTLPNIQHAGYWLAYRDTDMIHFEGGEHIPIQKIWRQFRDGLFQIYPHALELSAKMSKEQTHTGPAKAYEV